MKCDFDYCIYNRYFVCILDEIDINGSGQCNSCIMISLKEDVLEKLKNNQLCEIENKYLTE